MYKAEIDKLGILLYGYDDEKQYILQKYGKCDLKDLASRYQNLKQKLPKQLIKMVFKRVAQLIFLLASQNQYHTDIKPANVVLEDEDAAKFTYNIKVIDFASTSNVVKGVQGFTPLYFLSPMRSSDGCTITVNTPAERLRNEFYTFFRMMQEILLDKSSLSELFVKEKQSFADLEQINKIILSLYSEEIKSDATTKKIFGLIERFPHEKYEIQEIKDTIALIQDEVYTDNDKAIMVISSQKLEARSEKRNPLEILLSLKCFISLNCSRNDTFTNQFPLQGDLDKYLATPDLNIYLLLGKSGSGKSLFIYQDYLSRISSVDSGA